MSVYITGDTHRYFDKVSYACVEYATTPDDIMIILGDAGINYYLGESDEALKEELRNFPITLFMIHSNREERPSEIDSYEIKHWYGGHCHIDYEEWAVRFMYDDIDELEI